MEGIGQIKNSFLNKIIKNIKDIKAKHKKSDGQANIDKYRVIALIMVNKMNNISKPRNF